MPLVSFRNLHTYFYTDGGVVKAVNGVSFDVEEGQTVAVVGESGCGKSVTALSLMHLLQNPGRIVEGTIEFDGKDITRLSDAQMRRINGKDIAMIFQEPMTSLNPVFTAGQQIAESLTLHEGRGEREAYARAVELIASVGIPNPERVAHSYPHELSGGMRQRVMIAMALACNPRLLIADEPTTALDVTIQAQILNLMRDVKERLGTAIILITHDLGVVAEMAQYVCVMYCGRVIERSPVLPLYENPLHPYTQGLLRSKPVVGRAQERLYSIPGQVPSPINLPEQCAFCERCERCMDVCRQGVPPLIQMGEQWVACYLYGGKEGRA